MDREDGFERGFIAGWKARGEHEDGLRNRAEEALDELRSQLPDVVGEEDEIHRRWAQVGQAFCKNCGFPAKTCVCVPQQVNQQSWQGATARHDP